MTFRYSVFFWLKFSQLDPEIPYLHPCTWFYLCRGVRGPTRGFLRYPMGHSQGTCIDVGNSEVLRNFNLNPHHYLTSCSSRCTMYDYIKVHFIIYFRGTNILFVCKRKCFNKMLVDVDFVLGCPTDDL